MHPRLARAVAVAGGCAVLLGGCGAGPSTAASDVLGACAEEPAVCNSGERADGGEITWAVDGTWKGWNLTAAADNTQYLSQALVGMWPKVGQFDPNGEFRYNDGLFTSEPALVGEDPTRVEYSLNPDATWGDGTPIGLDDFVYHWYATSGDEERCEGCAPADTSYGSAVESIEADGSAVTVTYTDYASAEWKYQEVLSHPAHIAEREAGDWRNDPRAMAESQTWFSEQPPTWTTGPYRIADAATGEFVVYERNPEWAGKTRPTLDKLTFRVIDSLDSIVTEMRQGTIDGASPSSIGEDTIGQLLETEGVSFATASGPGWEHLDLNLENEFLADRTLRTAVLTAVDVEEIIARTAAQTAPDIVRKLNPLFRNDSPHFEDRLSGTPQGSGDVHLAAGLLEEAGYEWNDRNELLTPDGEVVELGLSYLESNDVRRTMAELVQAGLADLGIRADLEPIPGANYGEALYGGQFDMVIFGWATTPTFTVGANQMYASDSDSNFGGLDDPEVDELLDRLESTLEFDQAAEIANQAVELVVDAAYVLPIVDSPVAIMISDNLVNVRDNWASQERAMYNIAEWGVREN